MLFNDGGAYETSMGVWSRLVGDVFIEWVKADRNLKWLDVGCGNGAFSELIARSCFPSHVDAIDPSPEQIEFARSRSDAKDVNFRIDDAMSIASSDDTFDIAVMALVIFFVPEPPKGVSEMVRVVKKNGLVSSYAWDTVNGGSPSKLITGHLAEMGFKPEAPPNPQVSEMTALNELWSNAGLVNLRSDVITVERKFKDIEEYWEISSLFPNIQKIVPQLSKSQITELKARMEKDLTVGKGGMLSQTARANAIVGTVI
tara:strand:- start:1944 stop:2714 length:771 start_codon:yes stop_codon:yes gene_type:complete